jgi:peptide/nickel transport system ATP-binding protein
MGEAAVAAAPVMRATDLRAYYRTRHGGRVRAVDGVSLELAEGEVLGIAGESGCGKSTLARALASMFEFPLCREAGEVVVDGESIYSLDDRALRQDVLGRKVSYVPQSAMNALNPTRRVGAFVRDVMRTHFPEMSDAQIRERACKRLESLSLPERVLDSYPFGLSGGMQQRTVIMVSTLLDPAVVIADEPTSALDVSTQKVLVRMLRGLLDQAIARSLIFITHDLTTLRHICDRIAVMYAGEFVEVGTMEQIVFDPVHPYTRALLGSVLVPEEGIRDRELETIPGVPPDLANPPEGCRFAPRCTEHNDTCRAIHGEMRTVNGRLVRCPRLTGEEGSGDA